MELALTFGSLLAVAVLELCIPRRRREFPALWRRLGNLAIWFFNTVAIALIFASPQAMRSQLGWVSSSWPSRTLG